MIYDGDGSPICRYNWREFEALIEPYSYMQVLSGISSTVCVALSYKSGDQVLPIGTCSFDRGEIINKVC